MLCVLKFSAASSDGADFKRAVKATVIIVIVRCLFLLLHEVVIKTWQKAFGLGPVCQTLKSKENCLPTVVALNLSPEIDKL